MKKSFSVVLAIASIMTMASSASALNVRVRNAPSVVDGQEATTIQFFADPTLQEDGFCGYRLRQSALPPYNHIGKKTNCKIAEALELADEGCDEAQFQTADTFIVVGKFGSVEAECELQDAYQVDHDLASGILVEYGDNVTTDILFFGSVTDKYGQQLLWEVDHP